MGTLYVVGVPPGDPDDTTLRALRVLREVALVVAGGPPHCRHLLARYDIGMPFVDLSEGAPSYSVERVVAALGTGDVALLWTGWSPVPSNSSHQLICAAIERDFPVVPIPGPTLPLTALVISGLPADGFVFLDQLPSEPAARHELLASVADERRSLVALESPSRLSDTVSCLEEALGDRPLTVVATSDQGPGDIWRGTVGGAAIKLPEGRFGCLCALVIGGAQEGVICWDEDRLRAEIQACLDQGLGAKETSQQLAGESGWPRRQIYHLAVEAIRFRTDKELW